MKKIEIYTFSGTGNTMIASEMIAREFGVRGIECSVNEVRRPLADMPLPDECDMIGIGYPVHAFNIPKVFTDFVRTWPKTDRETKVFFFKTSGEPFHLNDASSYLIYRQLVKKGYRPMFEMHLLMPYNIMFRYRDSLAKQMYIYTQAMCRMLVKKLCDGQSQTLTYNLRHRALSCAFRIQQFGAWINGPMYSADKKKCSNCGLCVKSCPGCNISEQNGRIKFGWSCSMCMRCTMSCPKNAIRPGFLTPWRVNGKYNFSGIVADSSVPPVYVNDETTGYFKLFRKYYDKADAELSACGIEPPRIAFREEQAVCEETVLI